MPTKKSKSAPTDEELLAQFEDLGTETTASKSGKPASKVPASTKKQGSARSEQDLLEELGNLAQRPSSRPSTPSFKPPASGGARSPGRNSNTLSLTTARSSEERSATAAAPPRKSGDSARSIHQSFTPTTNDEPEDSESRPAPAASTSSGGGWWGGLLSTATAAVTQAQAAVKEIQQNEEAQRWAGQMRGNMGALKDFGGDLRSLALPTFQNILQTIAPPISSHERLQIHITHDLSGYPTLDPLIYSVFSRVMTQVEGGDLMVIQRGKEASPRRPGDSEARLTTGWNDGPWWRSPEKRAANAVKGIAEGSKLARASAESYASEHFTSRGGVEEVAKKAAEVLSETNPTRNSDIFLAIQAINKPAPEDLFAASSSSDETGVVKEAAGNGQEFLFAIYLHDPIHGIVFSALSQSMPNQWLDWLDASGNDEGGLPDSIADVVESGGVDPREWVAEWVEEALKLAVGVVAQGYVARRMGVGEGGVGRGKMKADRGAEETVESGGGEAARAIGGL